MQARMCRQGTAFSMALACAATQTLPLTEPLAVALPVPGNWGLAMGLSFLGALQGR